jgi:signal transduction histidine kinase
LKKIAIALATAAALSMPAFAEDYATAKDAEAMVGKVVKALAADKAGTIKEINSKDKKWVHMDLYPTVYTFDGTCLAHGQNEKLAGKNMIDMVDADGKAHIRERMELAKTKGKFWQDFKFKDPVSKQILPKSMYCETSADMAVCAGIYKR